MADDLLDVEGVCRLAVTSYNTFWLTLQVPEGADLQRLARGDYAGPLPLQARVLKRGRMGDLIGTGWATLRVISQRFRQVLDDGQLTGWRTFPVVVLDRAVDMPLHLLAITGRCGPEYGSSGVHRAGLPPLGMFLDPHEWDGADLFMPTNAGDVLLTTRAGDVVKRARLRNVRIEPAHYEVAV